MSFDVIGIFFFRKFDLIVLARIFLLLNSSFFSAVLVYFFLPCFLYFHFLCVFNIMAASIGFLGGGPILRKVLFPPSMCFSSQDGVPSVGTMGFYALFCVFSWAWQAVSINSSLLAYGFCDIGAVFSFFFFYFFFW